MATYVLEGSSYTRDSTVMLWGRNIETREIRSFAIQNFKPYFFIPDEAGTFTSCFNAPIRKIECENPSDMKERIKPFKESYDGDIPLDMRWRIDNKIMYAFDDELKPVNLLESVAPKIMYYDIEVSAGEVFPEPELAEFPIVTISCYNSENDEIKIFTTLPLKGCKVFKSEKGMIEGFARYIKSENFDVITGWFNQSFDDPYIFNRARKLYANISGFSRTRSKHSWERDIYPTRSNVDMMELFKDWSKPLGLQESFGLKFIANKFASYTYEDFGAEITELIDQKRFKALAEYAKHDVIALARIDKICGLINFYENLRKMTGVKLEHTLQKTRIYEYLLMFSYEYPLPTRTIKPRMPFAGAYVKEPIVGVHNDVGSVDLAALYPNIICGYNVSPDAFNMIPQIIIALMNKREELRAMRLRGEGGETLKVTEQSLKYVINSVYGVMAYPTFKLYDMKCAKFIPAKGQEIIKKIIKYLGDANYTVIYGDSVAGDTKLNLMIGDKLRRNIKIEDLFTDVAYGSHDGREYSKLSNVKINSLDSTGKSILVDVPYIMRHRVNKQMYRVWLNNTEYIDVTEDHSLFGYLNTQKIKTDLIGDRIVQIKPDMLGQDVKSLVVQKELSTNVNTFGYPMELYILMGMFLGDGSFMCKQNTGIKISLGNDTEEFCVNVIEPLRQLGWITTYTSRKNGDTYIGGEATKIINRYMRTSSKKECKIYEIPEFMFSETYENRCAFLRGLFDADGTVMLRNQNPIIRLSSISMKLCEDVKQLLLTLGISSSVFMGNTINSYNDYSNGSKSYYVNVKSIRKFSEVVGFTLCRKQYRAVMLSESNYRNKYKNCDFEICGKIKVEKIDYDGYVYDLSVDDENHRYWSANGILLKNTDSSYFKPVPTPDDGKHIEAEINEFLRQWAITDGSKVPPVVKFETLYRRMFFKGKNYGEDAAKKRYIGHIIWEDGFEENKLGYKGIELKRSDVAPITKNTMTEFFTRVLMHDDLDGAIKYIREIVKQILDGKIDIIDLAIPRGVSNMELNNPHTRGIRNTKNVLKYKLRAERKPKVLYCKRPVKEICIDEDITKFVLNNKVTIDYETIMKKTIRKKFESIFAALGKSWDMEIEMQSSLARWM